MVEVNEHGGIREVFGDGATALLVPHVNDDRLIVVTSDATHVDLAEAVCRTFRGAPYMDDPRVVFLDGDFRNCAAANLRWGVRKPKAVPLERRRMAAKLTLADVEAIRARHPGGYVHKATARELGARYDVTLETIIAVVKGRTWARPTACASESEA